MGYLFLCGSVVLHVKYGGNVMEFYETGLVDGSAVQVDPRLTPG